MTRLEANREILRLLSKAIETYPDQRFIQLLDNCIQGLGSSYYDESLLTLEELKNSEMIRNLK